MKLKNGFELREVCGEHIVVSYGLENIDFSKVISLNESAAYLWHAVEGKEFTAETLANLLCQEYDVDMQTALCDAQQILQEWTKVGLAD